MSRQFYYGGHSSIAVGHDVLDELVLRIQHHMVDVVMKVALFADVASLATAVAGLCEGFEGSSAVDVHWNTRGESMQRGVHCCRGCSGGGM
jgi:hypothetical protein